MAASKAGAKMNGCIINTVTQITSNPLQVAMTVNKQNLTCDLIRESGIVSVSILSEKAPFSLFQHFGFQSGRDTRSFWSDEAGTSLLKGKYNGLPGL